MEQFEDYLFKKNTKWLFAGLGVLVVLLLIFHAGYVVGRESMRPPFPGRDFHAPLPFGAVNLPMGFVDRGHGAVGTVSTISGDTITITEPDGDTETVTIASSTPIEGPIGTTTIAVGQHIIVVGAPDEAHETIEAKFIRIQP